MSRFWGRIGETTSDTTTQCPMLCGISSEFSPINVKWSSVSVSASSRLHISHRSKYISALFRYIPPQQYISILFQKMPLLSYFRFFFCGKPHQAEDLYYTARWNISHSACISSCISLFSIFFDFGILLFFKWGL